MRIETQESGIGAAVNSSQRSSNFRRIQYVRQDRLSADPERHTILVSDDICFKVENFSPFGIAIKSSNSPDDIYPEAWFCVDGVPINKVSLKKIHEYKIFNQCVYAGYSIEGRALDVEAVFSINTLNEVLSRVTKSFFQDAELRDDFKLIVLEIKDVLLKLESEINNLAVGTFGCDLKSVAQHEDIISTKVSEYLSKNLSSYYEKIKIALSDADQPALAKHFEYFRKNVGQIMYQAAYAHRAYTKPKGYAGDYEMMNHVYHREARGDTLFGKCLQRYFVDEPAGRAVRNREKYLRGKIVQTLQRYSQDETIKILSVASGPAFEIQNLIKDPSFVSNNVQFTLLDQDVDALKHAQRKILEICRAHEKTVSLKLLNMNIKEVIQGGLPDGNFNLIYSAGLFDYFTDPVAVYAARQLYKGLKLGGNLIIGNFSLRNPNQFAMGLIMDWNLIYRSEDKMKELFAGVGSYQLEQESQGINLFANIMSR